MLLGILKWTAQKGIIHEQGRVRRIYSEGKQMFALLKYYSNKDYNFIIQAGLSWWQFKISFVFKR